MGEWADAGLISPFEVGREFSEKYFPKAWEAVTHKGSIWGFPIGMETVALIYNRKLLDGPPPEKLSDLAQLNAEDQARTPGSRHHSLGLQERLLLLGHTGRRRGLYIR